MIEECEGREERSADDGDGDRSCVTTATESTCFGLDFDLGTG